MTADAKPMDLDALEAMEREATPGTWIAEDDDYDGFVSQSGHGPTLFRPGVNNALVASDARLVAALRNVARDLIAAARERESLKSELATVRGERDAALAQLCHWERHDCRPRDGGDL